MKYILIVSILTAVLAVWSLQQGTGDSRDRCYRERVPSAAVLNEKKGKHPARTALARSVRWRTDLARWGRYLQH